MNLIERVLNFTRPELVRDEQKYSNNQKLLVSSPNFKKRLFSDIYLSSGNLEQLESEYRHKFNGKRIKVGYFAVNGKAPCKYIQVDVEKIEDISLMLVNSETKLRLELDSRNCNAGVFYHGLIDKDRYTAFAIPANLTTF